MLSSGNAKPTQISLINNLMYCGHSKIWLTKFRSGERFYHQITIILCDFFGLCELVLKIKRGDNHKLNCFNVPDPIYNRSLSQKLNRDVALVVHSFSKAVKLAVKNSFIRIIDSYNHKLIHKRFSNGLLIAMKTI